MVYFIRAAFVMVSTATEQRPRPQLEVPEDQLERDGGGDPKKSLIYVTVGRPILMGGEPLLRQ